MSSKRCLYGTLGKLSSYVSWLLQGSKPGYLTNWSDLSFQGEGVGLEKLPDFQESCWIIKRGLLNLLRKGLPDQELIKKGWRHGRKKQYLGEEDQRTENEHGRIENEHGRIENEHDEKEMKEDKGEQNWRQEIELARFEGMNPLGWISQRRIDSGWLTSAWREAQSIEPFLERAERGINKGGLEEEIEAPVDGFARIRGQDRREENIRGEEGNGANCDGDMGVTTAGKVKKVVAFTAADKVAKTVVFTVAEKVAKAVVFTTAEKVAKVAIFSRDGVLGCGVNVKTVKTGKKRSSGGENASNWEQKGEDAIDNNGARKGEETPIFSWVKREGFITYEAIDTQDQTIGASNAFKVQDIKGSTKAHPNSKENVVQGCKTWHKKFKHLSWKKLAPTLLKIVEGNKRSSLCENWAALTQRGSVEILYESLQVDGAATKSVAATRADEFRVKILRTSQNWVKRIPEEWKSLEEDLPPPKPQDLNWRAASSGFPSYGNRLMKRSHEIKLSSSNLEDKVVLQWGVMIGYRVIGGLLSEFIVSLDFGLKREVILPTRELEVARPIRLRAHYLCRGLSPKVFKRSPRRELRFKPNGFLFRLGVIGNCCEKHCLERPCQVNCEAFQEFRDLHHVDRVCWGRDLGSKRCVTGSWVLGVVLKKRREYMAMVVREEIERNKVQSMEAEKRKGDSGLE
ncbi:hypothetical protein V8G54_034195 [Vigna mungo]|uniref:Uncharacterized protein n=1 Tax=Vigna mungo TaxID=3915 RepID=A0AAQ3MQ12_VIGMU